MMKLKRLLTLASAAFALSGCVELEVLNPNDPDAERAIRTPGDVEALIAGAWGNWWNSSSASTGVVPILATVSYQHSATAANFGMVEFSGWTKQPVHAEPSQVYYNEFANSFIWQYRAVAGVVAGINAINEGAVSLPADQEARARAYGNFALGLAHGSAALMYDQAYIYDPSISTDEVELHPYGEVMEAALGYFDAALAAAPGMAAIPPTWMSREVDEDLFVQLVHAYKARYRAAVARNPAERAAVDWSAVLADAQEAVTEDWSVDVVSGSGFSSGAMVNMPRYGPWGQLSYQVLGMADQSGQYQKWMAKPPLERHPNLSADQSSDPFLIMTPDLRFPQGAATFDTLGIRLQQENDGRLFEIAQSSQSGGYSSQWARPDRGTFRWSYYRYKANDMWLLTAANRIDGHNEVTVEEMDLLAAEAHYHLGNPAEAAALINNTRVAAGLNPTDASGLNTSCVPKLVDGACGDLFEMLKWEVRLETMYQGLHMASWYFHGRGWGDLPEGTFLHFPVPGQEAELIGIPLYTFGGVGNPGAAPLGSYGY